MSRSRATWLGGVVLILPALLGAGGCAPGPRTAAKDAFFHNDFAAAQELYAQQKDKLDRDFVLYNLEYASAAFEGGDYYNARYALERASQVMRGYAGNTEGIISLIANESAKLFKGDPFEQAMANFYDGLIYYRWGDYYNAAAAFRQALMCDKYSAENYRDDFAIVQYFVGRCYLKTNDPDNARVSFEAARKVYPNNPYFSDDAIANHNVIIVLQLGRAPVKVATGPAGSIDDYDRGHYRETMATVYANGKLLGNSSLAVDLLKQATTSGRSAKDTIQGVKGGLKTGAVAAGEMLATNDDKKTQGVGLILLLAGLLYPAQADLRQWDLLPGEIHVLSAKLEPGTYTFKIDFCENAVPVDGMRQIWHYVPVNAEGDTLLVFRSGRGRANGYMLPEQHPVFQREAEQTVARTDGEAAP